MPVVDPVVNLPKLRTTKHATTLYLLVYKPTNIWYTQVNGAQADGATAITVDAPTVVRAPQTNYQVLFGSEAGGVGGSDLGESRWKSYGAPTLNVGAHNAPLPNNAWITVKEEIKPRGIHVALSATDVVSEDDDIPYTNENDLYCPLARIGCPAVEFRDPTTGLATVNFWADPVAIAAGATIVGHSWDFKDGVPPISVADTTPPLPPIPVVFNSATPRYISYTCTDDQVPAKTHTRYIPVFTPNRTGTGSPYAQVEITSLDGDIGSSGWRASLRVLGGASTTEFPSGAYIVLFARDFYGNVEGSIGGQWTHRENIVFTGYIVQGTVEKNPATGAVEFDVEGIGVLASRLPGLAATFNTNAAPTDWHQFKGLTYNLAADHLLKYHSTLAAIADVSPPNVVEKKT